MQNHSFTPSGLYMKIGSTDSGGHVKLTPKFIIVVGKGGVSEFVLRMQSYDILQDNYFIYCTEIGITVIFSKVL